MKSKEANGFEESVVHKDPISKEYFGKFNAYFADVLDGCDPVKLTYFCRLNTVGFKCC